MSEALFENRETTQTQWHPSAAQCVYLPFKRFFDIVFSLTALIVLSPLFLIIAIIIKLDSPGPVIFKQKRAGKDGVPFVMYKFRSMVKNAEDELLNMPAFTDSPTAEDIKQRLENDPRITRTGKFIRRSSIDEFPQFLNVLIGNMSIVGPRPLPMREHIIMDNQALQRVLVKPGITCFWQVSGRSTLNEKVRVELDLLYLRKMGFLTDLLLVFKTIPAVLHGKGAY